VSVIILEPCYGLSMLVLSCHCRVNVLFLTRRQKVRLIPYRQIITLLNLLKRDQG
jgi:hypothetical protein